MLEFGEGAYPVPFDHNGDGLMDLIVANNGYFHPSGDHVGKLALLENVGTPTAPAFNMVTDDYMGLSTSGIGNGDVSCLRGCRRRWGLGHVHR